MPLALFISSMPSLAFFSPHSISCPVSLTNNSTPTLQCVFIVPRFTNSEFLAFLHVPVHRWYLHSFFLQHLLLHSFLRILLAFQFRWKTVALPQSLFLPQQC